MPAILLAQSSLKDARKAFENAARDAKARRIDQARRGYEQAVKLDPGYAEAWSALGRLQAQQQQYEAARKSFETAIRADPNLPDPYTPLAIILQSAHEWEALVETTNRLLQLDAYRYPVAWLLNATGHYNLKNLAAGREERARGRAAGHETSAAKSVLSVGGDSRGSRRLSGSGRTDAGIPQVHRRGRGS